MVRYLRCTTSLIVTGASSTGGWAGFACENFYLKKFYLKISLKTKTSYGFFR